MNRQEDEEYPIEQEIAQEQPAPSLLVQVIAAFVFFGFILALPTIIDRLGK